jgi:phosphoglycolate phosphatase-like HAD superfamily hydrolase
MRDALLLAEHPEEMWRPQLAAMRNALCSFVEEHAHEFCVEVLPGVREVLQHLRARGARLGVATGNLERIGWAKLERAGIKSEFEFGGFSDEYEFRTDVFRSALALARARVSRDPEAICVVGDTPLDVKAARANGLDVIAVATGVYSPAALREAGPDLLAASLHELLSSH